MSDPDPIDVGRPRARIGPKDRVERGGSFGGVASQYERYRSGPPAVVVDWILPTRVGTAVDLGAGTGALTRLLIGRAEEVIAVEPDERMRSVLTDEVPAARAVMGRGESMPLPDAGADAVLASSSWHWMDPIPTLREVGRVLVPGGTLGAVWSGPDPDGPFIAQARSLLAERSGGPAENAVVGDPPEAEVASLVLGDEHRPTFSLEIPVGVPFDQPEHEVFTWDVALDAEGLIGLLRTFSWIITMPEETRERVIATTRRLLREVLGVEGESTVDVAFRADAWRSRRS